jgi:hypothetical protein
MHIHHFQFFFLTITTLASHDLPDEAYVKQPLNFSLHFFWHLAKLLLLCVHTWVDLQFVLDYLSTYPHKVRGGPRKNIAILLRNARSFAYSSRVVSVLMQMTMSSTLGSSSTFWKLPSASMALLNSVEASCLMGHSIY